MPTAPAANLNCILLNACGADYNIAPGTCAYIKGKIYGPNANIRGFDPE
ncbi:MAG TPA: hypothetical protein VKV05_13945 [Terriglobales bacterium]|nr:hypothetical protein [Terriglobales bacterium]